MITSLAVQRQGRGSSPFKEQWVHIVRRVSWLAVEGRVKESTAHPERRMHGQTQGMEVTVQGDGYEASVVHSVGKNELQFILLLVSCIYSTSQTLRSLTTSPS